MFLKQTKKEQELFVNKQETNNFLIGNLMPDTTKDKARSHFRDPKYQGNMVEYPEISRFVRKYHNNPSVMGYLFHLYIDRKFFKEYMPRIIEFRDKEDVEEKMNKVKYVILFLIYYSIIFRFPQILHCTKTFIGMSKQIM